jgi:hypothetical protein
MSRNKNSQIKNKSELKNLGELSRVSYNEQAIAKLGQNFVVSFQYLDRNQGQTFEDWSNEGLLVNMLNTLRDYCNEPLYKQLGDKFTPYGDFPPKSKFIYPKHVPFGVNWASMHINGKSCLGGHIYENIFYVVFLDKNHEFWPCKKKHT